ncbi:MAG: LCP family protein [Oscillospiraceae bacterium]|nr:LCP family protein [Oscillospiraceae bacterium]
MSKRKAVKSSASPNKKSRTAKARTRKKQSTGAAVMNVLLSLTTIAVTAALILGMALNAPIISYHSLGQAPSQMSLMKYIKSRQPVIYREGKIQRMDADQVEYREDVDRNFDDLLDLNQTIEGQFTILFLGFDSEDNGSGDLHDVNYLAQFNLHTASLNILQIPRDTFTPDYTGSPTHKFNSIYTWGNPKETPIQRVVTAVEENYSIPVDAYLTTTCDNVAEIVDLIGGIPINMPFKMVFEADKVIPEGEQTLNGQQAEWMLRFRHGYQNGDIGRVQGQRLFMAAAMKKLISMNSLQIMSVTNKVYDQELIGTDMSLEDVARLADLAGTIDMDHVHVFMLPGESATVQGQSVWSVHKKAALNLVNRYFRTQQVPLKPDQSTLIEYVQEGEYRMTDYDKDGESLQDVDQNMQENVPELKNSYKDKFN